MTVAARDHVGVTGPGPAPGAGPGASSVVVFGHRLAPAAPTGIHRYVGELLGALVAMAPPDLRIEVAGSPEPGAAAASLPGEARPPITRSRRPLHMRWCTTGRPPLERLIGDFDLLHVLYPSTPVPTSSPSVVTLHDLMPITHPDWFARYERWAFERALRHLQRHTGLVIADSSAVADEAVRLLGLDRGRIRVVHLGVAGDFVARPAPGRRHTPTGSDPTGSDPTDDDQQQQRAVLARHGLEPGRYVVALGSISVRKNTTVLLDAWPTVAARHPDLRLVLVGPAGPDGPAIIERARRLGERVRITGWLPADEVAAVVRAALALAQPSLAEGFGMTPLEAMAAGVPVIVSSEGSLSEVVGDAAMRVPALDPPAWAEAIGRLADDDGLCAGLVAAGRARAAAFTWERTAARTVEVYREALGR